MHRRDGKASPSPQPSPARSWTHRGPVGQWFRFARIILFGPPGCILALSPTCATEAPVGVEEEISLTYAVTALGQVTSTSLSLPVWNSGTIGATGGDFMWLRSERFVLSLFIYFN